MRITPLFLGASVLVFLPPMLATTDFTSPELAKKQLIQAREVIFTFKLHHDQKYHHEQWNKICCQFVNLALLCQQSDNNKNDHRWLDVLGSPFNALFLIAHDKKGIHGNVSLNVLDEMHGIKFEATIRHDAEYDVCAWQSVVDVIVQSCPQAFDDKSISQAPDWVRHLAPIFADAVAVSGDDSGIHGNINLTWRN